MRQLALQGLSLLLAALVVAPIQTTASSSHDVKKRALMLWAVKAMSQDKLPVCTNQYPRKPYPLGCKDDEEMDAGLCYGKCPQDKPNGIGPLCYATCPGGFHDDGLFCRKPAAKGRGGGYSSKHRCKKRHSEKGCKRCGLLYYPKCGDGYHHAGCNLCSPVCPSGFQDIGVSCRKPSNGRGVGRPISSCSNDRHKLGLLCYDECKFGFTPDHDTGLQCTGSCPDTHPVKCGTFCGRTHSDCKKAIFNSVLAVVKMAGNVVGAVSSGGTSLLKSAATSAMKEAAKQVGHFDPDKLVDSARQKAEQALLSVVKDLRSKHADSLTGQLLRNGVDRHTATKAVENAFQSIAASSMADPDDSYNVLDFVKSVDPIGVTAVVDAFSKPSCVPQQVPDSCDDFPDVCGKGGKCAQDQPWGCKCNTGLTLQDGFCLDPLGRNSTTHLLQL